MNIRSRLSFVMPVSTVFCAVVFVNIVLAAEIIHIEGNVQVQTFGARAWMKAAVGTTLGAGDSVRTARRSRAEIKLSEEEKSFITIEEKTLIALNSSVPGQIDRFSLSSGKVYANVEKVKQGFSFGVSTPSAVAGVRGTGWSMESSNTRCSR